MNDSLLQAHLSLCVPLRIDELGREGKPFSENLARVRPYAELFGEIGDQLLFRGPRTREVVNKLVDALAVMSFAPGGVTVFGLHFESEARPG